VLLSVEINIPFSLFKLKYFLLANQRRYISRTLPRPIKSCLNKLSIFRFRVKKSRKKIFKENMWNCIEERETDPLGRIQRKLIFTEIYENEHYAKGKISIPKEIDIQVFF
jgi:hypothetical protein